MADKKYNQKYIKSRNQGLILKLLKNSGPKSRASISKEIGIVRSTVSEICNDMVINNIITEGKKVEGNIGKRPTLLYFNKDYYCFISIVITIRETNIIVCNLIGEIIEEETIHYSKEAVSAKEIINTVFKKTDMIISKIEIGKICLMSLGSPETFNVRTGKIKWAP
jgi:predicted transcriptional regulator